LSQSYRTREISLNIQQHRKTFQIKVVDQCDLYFMSRITYHVRWTIFYFGNKVHTGKTRTKIEFSDSFNLHP